MPRRACAASGTSTACRRSPRKASTARSWVGVGLEGVGHDARAPRGPPGRASSARTPSSNAACVADHLLERGQSAGRPVDLALQRLGLARRAPRPGSRASVGARAAAARARARELGRRRLAPSRPRPRRPRARLAPLRARAAARPTRPRASRGRPAARSALPATDARAFWKRGDAAHQADLRVAAALLPRLGVGLRGRALLQRPPPRPRASVLGGPDARRAAALVLAARAASASAQRRHARAAAPRPPCARLLRARASVSAICCLQ